MSYHRTCNLRPSVILLTILIPYHTLTTGSLPSVKPVAVQRRHTDGSARRGGQGTRPGAVAALRACPLDATNNASKIAIFSPAYTGTGYVGVCCNDWLCFHKVAEHIGKRASEQQLCALLRYDPARSAGSHRVWCSHRLMTNATWNKHPLVAMSRKCMRWLGGFHRQMRWSLHGGTRFMILQRSWPCHPIHHECKPTCFKSCLRKNSSAGAVHKLLPSDSTPWARLRTTAAHQAKHLGPALGGRTGALC